MTEAGGPAALFVGVGSGAYAVERGLEVLPRAVSDVRRVAEVLGDPELFGLAVATVVDPTHMEVVKALAKAMPAGGLGQANTTLVVLWAGHGDQNQATGSLRLYLPENTVGDPDLALVTADGVAEVAGKTGASQILLLIDTCRSGGADIDVARVVDNIQKKLPDRERRWVGVLASCQDFGKAVDGAFADKLVDLLTNGPKDKVLRLRWSSYQAGLRGDDLVDAMVKEWDEARQAPKPLFLGNAWLLLRNPLYRPGLPDQVVEHLLVAAQGRDHTEEGIWFTGREGPLRQIVSWVKAAATGLCVLTGPAATGKSAVAGRIVSLSDPVERKAIGFVQGIPAGDMDPGERSVRAHAHARGLTLKQLTSLLAGQLGIADGFHEVGSHHDVLAWAARQEDGPLVVIDGLDEAAEAGPIASELLAPLARMCGCWSLPAMLAAATSQPFSACLGPRRPGSTWGRTRPRPIGTSMPTSSTGSPGLSPQP